MAADFFTPDLKNKKYLDNGCSWRMTGDYTKLSSLSMKNGGHVTFGDNAMGKIIDVEDIGKKSHTLIEMFSMLIV
ncbi:hypothetical protein Patl1_11100 [Pistacia atlantica]|uniref:Uncharacterized protein n=1 Tax=Pistacia atlantica TaxID=434234 RepID=A0ACC1A654_9ROSI|nr:hypothetical protein Patl1_11100 [Pistacia atlantica]